MNRSRPRALFLCRGSERDGLGHVIRTRTIVEAADSDLEVELLVLGDHHPRALLGGLKAPWKHLDDERAVRAHAAEGDWEAVIFDLLSVEDETFETLSTGRMSASLSPVFTHLEAVDVSFNRTKYDELAAQSQHPRKRYSGVEYSVVRPECRPIPTGTFADHLDDDNVSLAICMGGSDASNKTLEVIDALRGLEHTATFWVILGEGYGHSYRALVDRVRSDTSHEIILAKTNRSMWRILRNCTLAVLAGGITTFEAAHAGLPSINILSSPDRNFLIKELVEDDIASAAGTFDDLRAGDLLRSRVGDLLDDPERLLAMHRRGKSKVDGNGPRRVIAGLLETLASR